MTGRVTRIPRRWRGAITALAGLGLAAGSLALANGTGAAADDDDDARLDLAVYQDGTWYHVAIDFLMTSDASEADIEAAKAEMLTRFPGAVVQGEGEGGGVHSQYVVNGPRWEAGGVTYYYNPAGSRLSGGDGLAELAASSQTWNEAGSPWTFTNGGYTTAGTDACATTRDNQNTIGWAALSGSTLGVTCTWSGPSNSGGEQFLEFDMQFSTGWTWTMSTTNVNIDFQSVATHEMGHALGLGHPPKSQCPGPIMCATYSPGDLVRTLAEDDIAGLRALYGELPTPTPKPTRIPASQERGPFRAVAAGAAHS